MKLFQPAAVVSLCDHGNHCMERIQELNYPITLNYSLFISSENKWINVEEWYWSDISFTILIFQHGTINNDVTKSLQSSWHLCEALQYFELNANSYMSVCMYVWQV